MAIDYNDLPSAREDGKPGPREGTTAEDILARVVKIGQLIYRNNLTLFAIYCWNQEPEQIAKGWGLSYTYCSRLAKRARMLGAEFLGNSHADNVLTTMMEWVELKKTSIEVGDIRSALYCEKEMSRIRDTWQGKSLNGVTGILGHRFKWSKPPITPEKKHEEAAEAEFKSLKNALEL